MKALLKNLNQRPIALYPAYIKLTGSLAGGALLSQCMYWFSKKDKFHKTDSEFIEELGLTAGEMRGAKSKVRQLEFVKIARKGVPAKTWYSIDWEAFQKAMTVQFSEFNQTGENTGFNDDSSLVKLTKLDELNSPNKNSEISQTYYSNTKTTTKTTTESNKKTPKNGKLNLSEIDPPKNLHIPTWQSWMEYKNQINKPYKTEQGIKTAMNQLAELSHDQQEACINSSIMNEYQGFFVENFKGNKHAKRETTFEREEREHQKYLQERERLVGNNEEQIPFALGRADGLKLL